MSEIKRINSLIKEYFSDSLMRKLERVYYSRNMFKVSKETFDKFEGKFRYKITDDGKDVYIRIKDNNDKILLYKNFIKLDWGKDVTFGTGTNRMGIIKDSYVFKLACDSAGCTDNLHEFIMSKELQPYVTKAYETNELICVCEYVRVFNETSDFENAKEEILDVLQALEERSSLMIDVGFILKNKTNWGWRPSTGLPVVLDYGYIYTELPGIQLTCSNKDCIKKWGINNLHYSKDYSYMVCPSCNEKYGSSKLQKLVTHEARTRMYKDRLDEAFKVTKAVSYFEIDDFGDFVELENGSDEMLTKKERLRVNYDDLMNKYREVCANYDRELLFNAEVDESISSFKEQLRRALLESKYNKDYANLTDSQKNEDPYEPIEFRDRYADINIKSDIEYEIEDIFGESIVESEKYDKIKSDFEDADSVFDVVGYTSKSEVQKVLSRYLVKHGKEPLVDDYEEEVNPSIDDYDPNNWSDGYMPNPINGYASVNWDDADEMIVKAYEEKTTKKQKEEYTKDGILKMSNEDFFNWSDFKGSEVLDLSDPEVKEKEEAKMAELEAADKWFDEMVFGNKQKPDEVNEEPETDNTSHEEIISVEEDERKALDELKKETDKMIEDISSSDIEITKEEVVTNITHSNEEEIEIQQEANTNTYEENPVEIVDVIEEPINDNIIYSDVDNDNPLADALKCYYNGASQPIIQSNTTNSDFEEEIERLLNEKVENSKLDQMIRFILPVIDYDVSGNISEIYFQEIELDITVEKLDEYGKFTIGDDIVVDGYHRIDNKIYMNRLIDGYIFDRENLEYVKLE